MPFVQANGKKALFIHIPRTGGTAIEAQLKRAGPLRLLSIGQPLSMRVTPQHLRMCDIIEILGEGYFDYCFTVVRNPYDRIKSAFHLQAAAAGQVFWQAAPRFSHWLQHALLNMRNDPWIHDHHLRPQWEFIGTGVEVFRYEDGLRAALQPAADLLGLSLSNEDLPYVQPANMQPSPKEDFEWDLTDLIRVEEAYARDFETFGYPLRSKS